jgi:F-type H+-transporting ATPase subunit b
MSLNIVVNHRENVRLVNVAFRYSVSCLIAVLIVVSPGFAADADAHHASSVLDLLYPAINFTLYCGLMYFLLRKPLTNGLQARTEGVAQAIAKAKNKHDEARAALAKAQSQISNITVEAKSIQDQIASDTKRESEALRKAYQEHVQKTKRQHEETIKREELTITQDLKVELANLVLKLAAEKLSKNLDLNSDKQLRERALLGLNMMKAQ